MGLPWFANRKNNLPESPPRSQCCNIFPSKSPPAFRSGEKTSSRGRREKSSRMGISSASGNCSSGNFPLPSAAEIENVFKKFDRDGDGKISSSELSDVMRCLGQDPTEEEVRRMMAAADADGDGYVDLSEFVALNTQGVDHAESLRDLKDAFKMFDVDGNGSISAEELQGVLRRLREGCSLDECQRMIRGVDADGDGQVNFDEFFAMMSAPNAV